MLWIRDPHSFSMAILFSVYYLLIILFSHWFEIICSCFTSLYRMMPIHRSLFSSFCSLCPQYQPHQSSVSVVLTLYCCLFHINASFNILLTMIGFESSVPSGKIHFNIFLKDWFFSVLNWNFWLFVSHHFHVIFS